MPTRITVTLIVAIAVIALFPCAGNAQEVVRKGSAYDCHRYVWEPTDPVSSRLRQVLDCYSGGLIAISQEVPADKYTGQKILGATWGHNVGHVAFISAFACSKLSGEAAPRPPRISGEGDKDGMVEWLKSSMEFCKQAFSKLSDAKLGESIPWNGFGPGGTGGEGNAVTRFAAALWVTDVMIERYGAFAGYMQLHFSLSDIGTVPLVTNSPPDPAKSR
jgi:hypothetical protein